jgi:hypothetical protein
MKLDLLASIEREYEWVLKEALGIGKLVTNNKGQR